MNVLHEIKYYISWYLHGSLLKMLQKVILTLRQCLTFHDHNILSFLQVARARLVTLVAQEIQDLVVQLAKQVARARLETLVAQETQDLVGQEAKQVLCSDLFPKLISKSQPVIKMPM